jgi:hypothetical protein
MDWEWRDGKMTAADTAAYTAALREQQQWAMIQQQQQRRQQQQQQLGVASRGATANSQLLDFVDDDPTELLEFVGDGTGSPSHSCSGPAQESAAGTAAAATAGAGTPLRKSKKHKKGGKGKAKGAKSKKHSMLLGSSRNCTTAELGAATFGSSLSQSSSTLKSTATTTTAIVRKRRGNGLTWWSQRVDMTMRNNATASPTIPPTSSVGERGGAAELVASAIGLPVASISLPTLTNRPS